MQIVKPREVKNLKLFTRNKTYVYGTWYVYGTRIKISLCNIGSQSLLRGMT